MTATDKTIIEVEARIAAFDRAFRAATASTMDALKAMECDARLLFLIAMRDEIDVTIRELSDAQPEASQ